MARDAKLRFYTVEKIGPNRELTHEGFLLCRNVPIARTGDQIYSANEVPSVESDPSGTITIKREPSEVFRPETIESFRGKSVTIYHPDADVQPSNWKELTVGVIHDPRQGSGDQSDLLLADLLVMDQEGIDLLNAEGEVEVSCGYDAEYVQDAPGQGRQVDIVGNHVAMVPEGRCGSRCRISDSAGNGAGGNKVATNRKTRTARVTDAVLKVLRGNPKFKDAMKDSENEEELEKALDKEMEKVEEAEEEEGAVHVHVGSQDAAAFDAKFSLYDARFDAMDKRIKDLEEKKEKEEETEKVTDEDEEDFEKETGVKDARKTKDSVPFADSFQDMVSLAEVIAPGVPLPTFDPAAGPKKTRDAMCDFRKQVLGLHALTPGGIAVIMGASGQRNFTADSITKLNCGEARTLFNSVGTIIRRVRDAEGSTVRTSDSTQTATPGAPLTGAEENKRNRDFWKDHS